MELPIIGKIAHIFVGRPGEPVMDAASAIAYQDEQAIAFYVANGEIQEIREGRTVVYELTDQPRTVRGH